LSETYDASEQNVLADVFAYMLRQPTKDGGHKRAANVKRPWWEDDEHEAAIFSHLSAWKHGVKEDPDSGSHPLVHLSWRGLAIAFQETYGQKDPALMEMFKKGTRLG
jgi:hypothetical protein